MNLDEYIKARDKDDNIFWRLSSGVHQNLLDEAIYKIEELEAELNETRAERGVYRLENKRLRKLVADIPCTCLPHTDLYPEGTCGRCRALRR